MNHPISLSIHLVILGALICLTTAGYLRHKRNVDGEFKWPEPDPNTDHFAHEASCHHYYLVISEDDITINKCPHGELFDYVEHKCMDKRSARCWSHHFGKRHHHIALKSSGSFTCPYAWGKYPDINDCSKYYVCLGGKVKHKKCAPFEHFDKISRKCVGTIFGVCADETDVVESDFKCPRNWGSFSFHKDCSKYYECLDREPNLRTCPNNTLFHEKRENCVPKHHVHCKSRYNPYSKKDETSVEDKVSLSENPSTTSSESRKPSVEKETVKTRGNQKKSNNQRKPEEKISPKAKINIEVQSGDTVSQITQAPKEVFDSTPIEPKKSTVENEVKSDVKKSSEAISSEGGAKVSQTTQAPKEVFDSTPNKLRKTSVESELKSDVKNSSEALSTERDAKVSQTAQASKDLLASQTSNELTTVETANSGSDLSQKETKELDALSKVTVSNETLMEQNIIKNNPLNDTDELPDSSNTSEFIEVSTGSETPASTASQEIAIESSQKIQASTADDKKDRITPMESFQATPSDECNPKDFTCVTNEEGNIIRCPEPDGIFPYPGNERRFMLCKESEIHTKFCPGQMIYSQAEKKCISKFIF